MSGFGSASPGSSSISGGGPSLARDLRRNNPEARRICLWLGGWNLVAARHTHCTGARVRLAAMEPGEVVVCALRAALREKWAMLRINGEKEKEMAARSAAGYRYCASQAIHTPKIRSKDLVLILIPTCVYDRLGTRYIALFTSSQSRTPTRETRSVA